MAGSTGSKDTRCRICPWLWGLVIVVAVGFAVWYTRNPPAPAMGPGSGAGPRGMMNMATPVNVAQAGPVRIPQVVQAIGTVTAFNTVAVRSRVDGELVEVAFQDGQSVKEGDLLARIDPRPFQVQLDQALGQQAQNEAQLKNAQRDLQRYRQLYQQQSVARQVLDAQEAQVQQLQAKRKSDQATVDNARLQLSYTRITAPIGGRLGLRRLDKGNLISAANADGLVTIAQTQPISVLFTIAQAQLPDVLAQLRDGQALQVSLYDRDDIRQLATGELMALDNQIDTSTGTLRLKAVFDNADQSLFPNQFVNVRLHVSTLDAAVAIPVAGAQYGSVGSFVYVVQDDGTVQMRKVELGRTDGVNTQVLAGLQAGDKVVVEGTDRLRDGARIQIRTPGMTAPQDADAPRVPGGATLTGDDDGARRMPPPGGAGRGPQGG